VNPSAADATYGYLTTTGRVTGRPHEVEIWFAVADGVVYVLSGSGGRSDWCRNLDAVPEASFRIDGEEHRVRGRRVTDPKEDAAARASVVDKYRNRYGGDLTEWRDASAAFAFDAVDPT
jgi:deazaflavin-dependent oxidoreductase (nitroreductase family)